MNKKKKFGNYSSSEKAQERIQQEALKRIYRTYAWKEIALRYINGVLLISFSLLLLGSLLYPLVPHTAPEILVTESHILSVGRMWDRCRSQIQILLDRGDSLESYLYISLVNFFVPFLAGLSPLDGENSVFFKIFYPFVNIFLATSFLILWWGKFWLLFVLYAFISRMASKVQFTEDNSMFKVLGNDSSFYSGLKLTLGEGSRFIQGTFRPIITKHLPGEATELLTRVGANNETNRALFQIIASYDEYPVYADGQLGSNLKQAMEDVQGLHLLVNGGSENERYSPILDAYRKKFIKKNYSKCATVILAMRAGIIHSFRPSAGGFVRNHTLPALIARGVVQGLRAFGEDYTYDERLLIRMGLAYGQREAPWGVRIYPETIGFEGLLMRDIANATYLPLDEGNFRHYHQWMEDRLALQLRYDLVKAFSRPDPFFIEGCFHYKDGVIVPLENFLGLVKKDFSIEFFESCLELKHRLQLQGEVLREDELVKMSNIFKLNQEDCFIWSLVMIVFMKRNYLRCDVDGEPIRDPFVFRAKVKATDIVGNKLRTYSANRVIYLKIESFVTHHLLDAQEINLS